MSAGQRYLPAVGTYVRKIGVGQYEFGHVRYSTSYRKRPDIYTPAGVETSVSAATRLCETLSTTSVTGVTSNA